MWGSTAVWRSKIGWQLCALRVLREQRVLALDKPSSHRVGGFGLIAESCQSYVRGAALSREPPSYNRRSRCLQNGVDTARCCGRVINVAGERSQECATLTCGEKPQQWWPSQRQRLVWYLCVVPGMGVWACGCVFGGGMSDAMGKKARVKLFRRCKKARFGLQSEKAVFDWQMRLCKKWPYTQPIIVLRVRLRRLFCASVSGREKRARTGVSGKKKSL